MINSNLFKYFTFLLLVNFSIIFCQKQIRVNSAEELKNALTKIQKGTSILLADGEYDFNSGIEIKYIAHRNQPVFIKAENRGKAVITGNSRFILTASSNITIEGLIFKSSVSPAIELRGCNYVTISRNTFRLIETMNGSWLLITGIKGDSATLSHHNLVTHNHFERKSLLGNFLTIEGTQKQNPQVSQYDVIEKNLFVDIGPRVENVLEAIRIGGSEFSLSSGFTQLRNNLFEKCDGDPEYISIKSSDNMIYKNTFRECLGSLSLRHGNRNTVKENYILGNGRTGTFLDSTGKTWSLGTGGPRFCGDGMRMINNYLEGLTGKKWDATFAIPNGDAEYGDGQKLTKHFRINNAEISGNVLINNVSNLEIGYDGDGFQGNWWKLPPKGMLIKNNLIIGSKDTLIKMFSEPENTRWMNNIVFAEADAIASAKPIKGVKVKKPILKTTGNVKHLPGKPPSHFPLERKNVGPDAD